MLAQLSTALTVGKTYYRQYGQEKLTGISGLSRKFFLFFFVEAAGYSFSGRAS